MRSDVPELGAGGSSRTAPADTRPGPGRPPALRRLGAVLVLLLAASPGIAPGLPPACYRTAAQLHSVLQAYADRYPALVELIDYGDSWDKVTPGGPEGFDLWALRLTNKAIPGPKPRFFAGAGLHAREFATVEFALAFAEDLLSRYDEDAGVTALLDYSEIYLAPMTNPDGHLQNELHGGDWRKNTDADDGCSARYGVDLNRNHGFKWGCCGGSSASPCEDLYRGPSAGSEPEIQAFEAFVRGLFPDQRGPEDGDAAPITTTGLLIDYHSVASSVLYPWGWTAGRAPNKKELEALARRYAVFTGYAVTSRLYPVDGATRDWAYGELGIAALAVELDGTAFYEPCDNLPGIIGKNLPAAYALARLAGAPYQLIRGPDTGPLDVIASGSVVTVTASVGYLGEADPFAQPVGGAWLYVDEPPGWGGEPRPLAALDGEFDGQVEVVRGAVDLRGLAPGRHTLFVRGRGAAGFGGLESWGPASPAFVIVPRRQWQPYLPVVLRGP